MSFSWEQVQKIFEEARGLRAEERAGFLDKACAGDAALRAEVESLLGHLDQAGAEFLKTYRPPDKIDSDATQAGPIRRERPADAKANANGGIDGGKLIAQVGAGSDAGDPSPDDILKSGKGLLGIPSDLIEGYTLLRELHRGGQGIVYQAIQKGTKRKVAIKVLLEGPFASKSARRRFEREIELVARLRHANIVEVFHSGQTTDGRQYCVMDYVRGTPLDQYVKAKKLSMEEALGLFAKVCEAVNYAHQRGVIHRDLKPSNILVDSEGIPKVLDFGLAKMLAGPEETLVSMTGQVVGTLPYMSPEQAKGNPDEIDIRTDVYSLGVILYEVLTGTYPYPVVGQMAEVLNHIASTPPTPPSRTWKKDSGVQHGTARKLRAGTCPIDDEVQTIVLRSLAKERDRRYQSAGELAKDVEHYLKDEPIEAKKDSRLYILKAAIKRNKAAFITAAVFVVLVLASAIGMGVLAEKARRDRTRAEESAESETTAREETQREKERAEQSAEKEKLAREEAQRERDRAKAATTQMAHQKERADHHRKVAMMEAYVANLAAASMSLDVNDIGGARRYLGACDKSLRGWEWRYLIAQVDTSIRVLSGHDGLVESVGFSPDGKRVLTGSQDGTARIWDANSGQELMQLHGHKGPVNSASFSMDGTRITTSSGDGTVRLWDSVSGKEMALLVAPLGYITSYEYHEDGIRHERKGFVSSCFSPDNKRVVTASVDNAVRLWDAVTGKQMKVLHENVRLVRSASFSPDGSRVVVAGSPASILDSITGTELAILNLDSRNASSASFSPDGKRVVTGTFHNALILDAVSGKKLLELQGHKDQVASAAFSPDGAKIVTGAWDKTARVWDVATGKELAVLRGHESSIGSVSFDPLSSRIVSGSWDHTARIWDIPNEIRPTWDLNRVINPETAGKSEKGNRHTVSCKAFALSLDGKSLALVSAWRNTLHVLDLVSGRECASLRGDGRGPKSVTFSPNKKFLLMVLHDNTAEIWNADLRRQLAVLRGHEGDIKSASFSPNSEMVVTASADNTARVWDVISGKELTVLRGHTGVVKFAALSPDGTCLLTIASDAYDMTVRTWAPTTGIGRAVLRGHKGYISCCSFSPDGSQVVVGTGRATTRVWNVATGAVLRELRGHKSGVLCSTFSPDGKLIATGSADKTARIWDATTGRSLSLLRGHEAAIETVAFSLDGTRIVTGSRDKSVRIWDVATGRELLVARGHKKAVTCAMFSRDGTRLLTLAGGDSLTSELLLWDSMPFSQRFPEIDARRKAIAAIRPRILQLLDDGRSLDDVADEILEDKSRSENEITAAQIVICELREKAYAETHRGETESITSQPAFSETLGEPNS